MFRAAHAQWARRASRRSSSRTSLPARVLQARLLPPCVLQTGLLSSCVLAACLLPACVLVVTDDRADTTTLKAEASLGLGRGTVLDGMASAVSSIADARVGRAHELAPGEPAAFRFKRKASNLYPGQP
jgi:hypothetical protein